MINFGQSALPLPEEEFSLLTAELFKTLKGIKNYSKEISFSFSTEALNGEPSEEALGVVLHSLLGLQARFTGKLKQLFAFAGNRFITEYDTWITKNTKSILDVESCPYDKVSASLIDIPTGMKLSYPECAMLLTAILTKQDIVKIFNNAYKTIDMVMASVAQGSSQGEAKLRSETSKMVASLRMVEDYHQKLFDGFSNVASVPKKVEFSKQFKDMEELQTFRTSLSTINKELAKFRTIQSSIPNLEKRVGKVVDYMLDTESRSGGDYIPTKTFVTALAEYIGTVDSVLSIYGDAGLRAMALTHNATFVYHTLRGK